MGTYQQGIAAAPPATKSLADKVQAALVAKGFVTGSLADRTAAYFRSLQKYDDPDCNGVGATVFTQQTGTLVPVVSTEQSKVGGTSIKLQNGAAPTLAAMGQKNISALMTSAGNWTMGAWVWANSAGGPIGMRLAGTGTTGNFDIDVPVRNQWTWVTKTVPYDNVGTMFVRGYDLGITPNNFMYFGAMTLVKGDVALPYKGSMAENFRYFLNIKPDPYIDPSKLV